MMLHSTCRFDPASVATNTISSLCLSVCCTYFVWLILHQCLLYIFHMADLASVFAVHI